MLLLLRVFGDTARTESLFDRIASRWQLFGPVTMIAAPDVVAAHRRSGRHAALLHRQPAPRASCSRARTWRAGSRTLDVAPDGDGRYRVTEFCCRDDTWQATIVA